MALNLRINPIKPINSNTVMALNGLSCNIEVQKSDKTIQYNYPLIKFKFPIALDFHDADAKPVLNKFGITKKLLNSTKFKEKIMLINIDKDIIFTQDYANLAMIHKLLTDKKSWTNNLLKINIYGEKKIIVDGHHRLIALLLDKQKQVWVNAKTY